MNFQFCLPTRVVCGPDNINQLDELFPAGPIVIVADPIMGKIGVTDRVQKILASRETAVFTEVEPNPSFATADKAAALARSINAVGVVGIGGGSSLDVAKAAAMLCTNEGSIKDYLVGGKKLENKRAFLICVPTTAGTGSEVSNVGVFTDHEAMTKRPWLDPGFLPDIALLDPVMTFSMPRRVTAATGLDALCHSLESFWATRHNPVSQSYSVMAIKLIFDNLVTAINEPDNVEARTNMSVAALLGGMAFGQTHNTLCHGLSFGFTTHYGIDHGTACILTLAPVARRFYKGCKKDVDLLLTMLGCEDIEAFACKIEKLMDDAGVSRKLSDYGVKREDLMMLAQAGLNAPVSKNSPVTLTEEECFQMLEEIF